MRERTPQRITCVSSHGEGAFYFSQSNTEEQNTQSFTETLSQPITQNVTANVSWKASVTSVCRRRSVTEWPLPRPLPRREGEWSPRYPYKKDVGFALSLISIENSSNALWYLYAEGVLWARNVGGKVLLGLCALWEKELPTHASTIFSHRRTQMNRTHKGPQRH